jgi:hypothetical protein
VHEFTLFNKIVQGRTTQLFSMSVLALSIGITSIGIAHAEQYCKSIDNNGSASYTLAPETGCNKKKFKTVSVSHHFTPASPETVKANTSTDKAAATTKSETATPVDVASAAPNASNLATAPSTPTLEKVEKPAVLK